MNQKGYIRTLLIIISIIFFVFTANGKNEKNDDFIVVIDAGHGGKDIGAADNGVKEKDINLKVAKYLESLIRKKMKDTKVVMTREDDIYLTLQQRADKANKSQGDIFISIHTNSVDKKNRNRKTVAGSSVYTLGLHKDENNLEVAMRENSVIELEQDYEQKYSGFDPQRDESYIIFEMAQKKNLSQSIKFAESIENELVKSGRQNRGVHQAGFWVLWATSMPSVLVELDFICNPESARYISSDKGAKELAEAIFKALQKYEVSWRKSVGASSLDNSDYTYIEDSESKFEETYISMSEVPVATARIRKHKTDLSPQKKSSERKRRSVSSRILSLNNSYENSNISLPSDLNLISNSQKEVDDMLAMASVEEDSMKATSQDNKKKKKEKKKKEEKKKEEKKSRRNDAHNAKVNKLVTVYKIQILASSDLLSQGNSRFCGLSPITTYKENNLYKYFYGESTDKEEIEEELVDVRRKIPDAFIVTSQKSVRTNK